MNALGIILTAIIVLWVVSATRKIAALGVLAGICYVTQGQQFLMFGFHFTAIRFILLAGLVRLIVRGDTRDLKLNGIDKAVLVFAAIMALMNIIRIGTSEVFVYQLGCTYDVLLSYFVFRGLIKSWQELQEILPNIAWLIVPLALCMGIEALTGKNVFSAMGGQSWEGYTREGRYRCMGSFRAPHTAGIFAATLMPLFIQLWFLARHRLAAVAGIMAASMMVYTSNSSGPLLAYLCTLVGVAFWALRLKMRTVRWGLLGVLLAFHVVMKPPVWYLLAKISALTGGDGWHRSYLMDQCIKHFSDWWVMGTDNTGDWAATVMSWGGADLSNQYVSCAANGGLAAVVLFILLLVRCFRGLGNALAETRENLPQAEKLFWALGCALFAHVVSLFSITYFDQLGVAWWGLLAIISSSTSEIVQKQAAVVSTEPEEVDEPDAKFAQNF